MNPTFELPKRKHLVHKAIEPVNLSKSTLAAVMARQNDYWEIKFDGCHAVLIKANGKAYGFSRQGEVIRGSMDGQLKAMEFIKADNFVIFCEGWSPELPHNIINGDFRRGYEGEEDRTLQAVIFDYVPLDHFMEGKSPLQYGVRREYAKLVYNQFREAGLDWQFEIVEQFASKDDAAQYVQDRQECGHVFVIDGFMRKDPQGTWTAGAGSCGSVVKDKEKLTVDLEVKGLVEGKGKFTGMLGAYQCTYKGKPQLVGGGALTDKQRKAIWADQHTRMGGIGSIIEVHALGESAKGLLREPRFARFRADKTEGE